MGEGGEHYSSRHDRRGWYFSNINVLACPYIQRQIAPLNGDGQVVNKVTISPQSHGFESFNYRLSSPLDSHQLDASLCLK